MDLDFPLSNVIILHIERPPIVDFNSCLIEINRIQNETINVKEYNDIGPNFIICGDGSIIEARGLHKVGAHTKC